MIPSLPTDDPAPQERRARLARARDIYLYDHDSLAPLPLVAKVPSSDEPRAGWLVALAKLLISIRLNAHRVGRGVEASRANAVDLGSVVSALTSTRPGAARDAFAEIVDLATHGHVSGRPSGKKDYSALFQSLDLPANAGTHHWDATFARMRVAGPDPLVIRRMTGPDARLPVTDAHLRAVLGERDSLAAAWAEGRLYLADYAILEGLALGEHVSLDQGVVKITSTAVSPKFLPVPLALFGVPSARGTGPRPLLPIAIQLSQRPGPDAPVFGPHDGWGWTLAKSFVQTADGHHHQVAAHFAGTHMVVEPFVIAAERQLDRAHPLAVLLRPHFEGTLYINDAAQRVLLAPKGGVDLLMSTKLTVSRGLAATVVGAMVFDAERLPDALRARGVHDADALPDYPYRDDGLLLWEAIHAWVADYLRLYYASDAVVLADPELQAWAAEVRAGDGGRMKSFAPSGRIESLAYLVNAVAHLIFTGSAQHAAVNFPQNPLMSFAPAMPLAAYRAAPTSKEGLTQQDYLDALPPLDMAQVQRDIGTMLGGLRYTQLGAYERDAFADPRVKAPAAAFAQRLAEIEALITARNTERPAYEFLLPSLIPQGINV